MLTPEEIVNMYAFPV